MAILQNNVEQILKLVASCSPGSSQQWHGITVSVLAEDSFYQFPQPGEVLEISANRSWKIPTLQGQAKAQIFSNYQPAEVISFADSGLVAMIQFISKNRKNLTSLVQMVLGEFWVAGTLQTNERFLSELLLHPWVKEEIFHAGFVDEEFLPLVRPPIDLLLVFVAVVNEYSQRTHSQSKHIAGEKSFWLVGDRYIQAEPIPQLKWFTAPLVHQGLSGEVQLENGVILKAATYPLLGRWVVRLGQWCIQVRQVMGKSSQTKRSILSALVTGKVLSVLYRHGVKIPSHEPLIIIESLGHLIPHALPWSSTVLEWKVRVDEHVYVGQELAEIEVYNTDQKR